MNRHPENGDTDMSASTPTSNITLFGSLGHDLIERYTADRTYIEMVPDPAVEDLMIEQEFTIPGLPYWKLSLSVRDGRYAGWHDCVVWDPENRTAVRNAPLARKGDRVALVGHHEPYSQKKDGETIRRMRFVVEEFHLVDAAS
jgi:single-stranded DNA-binding protein